MNLSLVLFSSCVRAAFFRDPAGFRRRAIPRGLVLLLVFLAAGVWSMTTAATVGSAPLTSNPMAEFSAANGNPNGVWSYRWFDSPSAMGNMPDQSADWFGPGLAAWGSGAAGSTPCVLKNNSSAAFTGWAPGVLGLHPGATGRQPVVTWTAPAAGNYTFASSFTLVGSGGDGVVPSVSRNLGTDNIGLGSQLIGTAVAAKETPAREPVAPYVGIQFDMFYAPLAKKGFVPTTTNCCAGYYRKDDWSKNHPIFDGLPSGGIMDLHYYRNIVPTDKVMMQMQNPDEAVAGAINACLDYASGLYVGVYKLGAGRFIISNLQILENLGTDPAAERLLRNMLNYLAVDESKPPEQLPADWNEKLIEIGYSKGAR